MNDVGQELESGLRKARLRLIPLLSVCYLVAFMDRANISFAAESMNRDLHFTPKMYGLGAGLFFLSYALCEIPANRMLLRFGARRWLARIMLTWGLMAAGMMLIRGPWSFYGLRLLLGVAEAGFFPGVIFYLSQWFPAAERARSIALFYIAFPLSNLVMGAAAGTLLRQNGRLGLAGWQWLFLVEGVPAVLLSVAVWRWLPDGPAGARWLSEGERRGVVAALAADPVRLRDAALEPEGGDTGELQRALRSGAVWTIGLFFFCTLGSYYAVTFSLPLVLKGVTGWSVGKVGFVVAGFGLVGAAGMIVNALHSDRQGERRLHIVVPALLQAAGLLAAGAHLSGWLAVGALLLALTGYYTMQGPLLGLPTMLLSGEAAAVAIAMITMCGVAGGFVGPYWMGWMREATGSYAWGIGGLCVPCGIASLLMYRLMDRIEGEGSGA